MCPLSGEGESQTDINKEFCLYRGILGPAHGQFFQLLWKSAARVRLAYNFLVKVVFHSQLCQLSAFLQH